MALPISSNQVIEARFSCWIGPYDSIVGSFKSIVSGNFVICDFEKEPPGDSSTRHTVEEFFSGDNMKWVN